MEVEKCSDFSKGCRNHELENRLAYTNILTNYLEMVVVYYN